MLHLNGIHKSYFHPVNKTENIVLSNLSLELKHGSFHTIIGSNGSGKSTLLQIIAGLIKPDRGDVSIKNNISTPCRFGMVWQDYRESNLPWLKVWENIAFPLKFLPVNEEDQRQRATKVLCQYMPEVDPDLKIYQLSGGQQQIIAVLRNIVAAPDVLLADEPFSALDQARSWEMIGAIEELWRQRPIPVLWVSHDIDEAILLADKISCLSRKTKSIEKTVVNKMPRPRSMKMIYSNEHMNIKKEIIEFLISESNNIRCKAS